MQLESLSKLGLPTELNQREWPNPSTFEQWQNSSTRSLEAISRRTGIGLKELAKPESLLFFGAVGLVVGGTLAHEIGTLSKGPIDHDFALRYIKENILPSVIWLTPPNELIAMASGKTAEILRNFDPAYIASLPPDQMKEMANKALSIYGSQFFRWATVGVYAVSNIVNTINIGRDANKIFKEKVLLGKESLLTWWEKLSRGNTERIIRFSGKTSDVTEYDLDQNYHILPIFEDPPLVRDIINEHSKNGNVPLYWQVDSGKYSEPTHWEGFHVKRNWLTKTARGKNVLIIEADASVGEQALALAPESADDLNLQEVTQGIRMIRQICSQDKIVPDKVFSVLLANSKQILGKGNTSNYTMRQQNDALHHADIILDAQAPLIQAIHKWIQGLPSSDEIKHVIFNTNNESYFDTVSAVLSKLGYQVLRWSPTEELPSNIPQLVYRDTTADTVETVRTLIDTQKVSSLLCCPLIDRVEGLNKFEEMKTELGEKAEGLTSVCSAKLYSDLFKLVRTWVRMGFSKRMIQEELDAEWEKYLK